MVTLAGTVPCSKHCSQCRINLLQRPARRKRPVDCLIDSLLIRYGSGYKLAEIVLVAESDVLVFLRARKTSVDEVSRYLLNIRSRRFHLEQGLNRPQSGNSPGEAPGCPGMRI